MQKISLSRLFWATFYLSVLTFGGGYVIISLMQQRFVKEYHWLTEEEMLDFVAIAQSAPGAIAINGAIAVGYKLAGFKGILTTVLATIFPPLMIISILAYVYETFIQIVWIRWLLAGMQLGVAALIVQVVINMVYPYIKDKKYFELFIFIGAILANLIFSINAVTIILICLMFGIIRALLVKKEVSE